MASGNGDIESLSDRALLEETYHVTVAGERSSRAAAARTLDIYQNLGKLIAALDRNTASNQRVAGFVEVLATAASRPPSVRPPASAGTSIPPMRPKFESVTAPEEHDNTQIQTIKQKANTKFDEIVTWAEASIAAERDRAAVERAALEAQAKFDKRLNRYKAALSVVIAAAAVYAIFKDKIALLFR